MGEISGCGGALVGDSGKHPVAWNLCACFCAEWH